jgi:hypothetical protein
MEKAPRGTNSTKGLGKTKPLEKEFDTFEDNVIVPCGHPVPSGVKSDLMYNEYIVYDKAQVFAPIFSLLPEIKIAFFFYPCLDLKSCFSM